MKQCTRLLFLLGIVFLFAGCSSVTSSSLAPPLVFPTAPRGSTGPVALGIYASANNKEGEPVSHNVFSLNAQTGQLRWQDTNKHQYGTPLVESSTVYVGAADHKVYALDAGTGSIKWTRALRTFPNLVGVEDGLLFVGSNAFDQTVATPQPDAVYALDTSTGAIKWKSAVMGFISTLINHVIYLTTSDNRLYALNSSDGSALWQFQADAAPSVIGVENGQIGVLAVQNTFGSFADFSMLNASTGTAQWRFPSTGTAPIGVATVDAGVVYLASRANPDSFISDEVVALNASDGSTRWQNAHVGNQLVSFWVDNGALYVGSGVGGLYALSTKDGTQLWENPLGAGYPVVTQADHGLLYVASFGDGLFVVNEQDGKVRWRSQSASAIPIFAIVNGVAYGVTQNGQDVTESSIFLAFNTNDGSVLWRYSAGPTFVTAQVG
jgi:outer membrane protein assembly factor BamB